MLATTVVCAVSGAEAPQTLAGGVQPAVAGSEANPPAKRQPWWKRVRAASSAPHEEAGTAEAGPGKKQPTQPAAVDMDNGGVRDDDRDRDKDLPKRGPNVTKQRKAQDGDVAVPKPGPIPFAPPVELQLKRAASRRFDLRALPARRPVERERPELEPPAHTPIEIESDDHVETTPPSTIGVPTPNAPAPVPDVVFEGLDREFWGAGSPPDTTGDVGPQYYVQAVNTSVGIYDKAGNQQAAFTFDTLMSQGAFGNLCDTDNFGDPVVLYDSFEDRWVLTDFAFLTDGGGSPITPAYQCFAVSLTGNPITGGWNFYSIQIPDFLNDYEKLAIWPDGIYMSANMFGFGPGGAFSSARVWAFNKMQMYAGSPTVQVVAFNVPGGDFTLLPSNARLQTGTPPPGRPNLFISSWLFTNALTVYKFHVDWNSVSLSTFTGPDTPIAATSWPNAAVANAPQPGTATLLDVLQIRAMMQNQYTNLGGTESLWVPHTVRRGNTSGFAAPRWYQVDVTGGTVNPAIPQAATWDPDGANTNHRFMPSLALDRAGNLAMGYSISNATTMFPSIAYAGRLAGDPVNTFGQTETMMFTGTASQTLSSRWGDYSTMTLDPDGCTFWYTNEYANPADQTAAKRWKTKIGSFQYPSCTPVGAGGTVTGTVTVTPGGTPISGATITFGVRSTTTNGSGVYSFLNIPAGTYPSISATKPGYSTASASAIVVTDGGTTVQDFALTVAPASACFTDTTLAEFQTGVLSNVDLTTSPGDVTLVNIAVDQQNTAGTTTGTGFGTPGWTAQTFIPSVTGQLLRVESTIFCNGCGATPPDLTLSVRATAAGLPTGADLASVTIPGSNYASGASVTFMATFGAPATLTGGTQYALVMRPVSVPAGSGYFWIRSSPSTYANGQRVLSADSGATWSVDLSRDYNFKAVMAGPYNPASGDVVSGTKDSNPAAGLTPIWSTLSWTGTTPANTTLQFQVAGSNNPGGPFNFVGPDGTAGTFYTMSPGTLGPLYNVRYAKCKAYLATANNAVTPALNDVTLCTNNVDCSTVVATITPTPASVCDNSAGNTASGPAGMTSYSWSITNGSIQGSTTSQSIAYTAGASGNVGLTLSVVAASGCTDTKSVNVPIFVTPAQPTITPGGPTTFCAGGSVTLTSSSATGNQWYDGLTLLVGETNQTYNATANGNYNVVVTSGGCSSAPSSSTTVTVTPAPATPTVTPGGPATFCTGGSVTLTSSSATGNQWYDGLSLLVGETNQTYNATASGNYNVVVTASGCSSAPSSSATVTVNPIPATPTIAPAGPTTFCTGGSVSLSSSSASGNQWFLNGNPIGGATNQAYVAAAAGSYTVVVTTSGCSSASSAATTVTINPNPNATITAPTSADAGTTGNAASTANAGAGATYTWLVTNGTITAGAGTPSVTFTAGAVGTLTLNLTVTTAAGCSDVKAANVNVTNPQKFDPNGDAAIDPSDIFYLVAYLFTGGPAPAGVAGMPSGDANGDSVVDPADIFYAVNYLFGGGPAPFAKAPGSPVATSAVTSLAGTLTLGQPVRRGDRWLVPVLLTTAPGSPTPQALSLRVQFSGEVGEASVLSATGHVPLFETTRRTEDAISYLVAFSENAPLTLGATRSTVIAELDLSTESAVRLELDPELTMLVGDGGIEKATVANHALQLRGTTIGRIGRTPRDRSSSDQQ